MSDPDLDMLADLDSLSDLSEASTATPFVASAPPAWSTDADFFGGSADRRRVSSAQSVPDHNVKPETAFTSSGTRNPVRNAETSQLSEYLDIEQVFDRAAIGMALVGLDNVPLRVNKAYCDLLGRTAEQVLSGDVAQFIPTRDREMELARYAGVIAGTPVSGLKKRYLREDGSFVYGLLASWLITDANGIPQHVFTQVLDITDRHHGAERMALMAERLEEAQKIAEVGSFAYDHASGYIDCSPQFRRIYRLPDVTQFSLENLIAVLPAQVQQAFRVLVTGNGTTDLTETRNAHYEFTANDGTTRTVISSASTELDEHGASCMTTGISQDATSLLAMQRQVELAASHDRLTGLPARDSVLVRARELLEAGQTEHACVAALHVNLDGFKTVNDSLGHDAGDDLLRQVAVRLQGISRQSENCHQDILGRLGSDEFMLVCYDTSAEEATAIAGRITDTLATPIQAGDRNVFIRAGIGIVLAENGCVPGFIQTISLDGTLADPSEALLAAASEAVEAAKAKGRGIVEVFSESRRDEVLNRMTLEQDLWEALDAGQVTAVFQPILDVHTGKIAQIEVFARWEHPDLGTVSPAEFISIAEEAGLAPRLGQQMLTLALGVISQLDAAGHPGLAVSVNLSAQQFVYGGLPASAQEALAVHGLEGNRLVVEVTETSAMLAGGGGREQLAKLRATGVQVAIDDFGSGYSSLNSLREVPMDYVKIDRAFTSTVLDDGMNADIVATVARLTRAANGRVVAEAVETREQLDRLIELGVDFAQGWYISRPLTCEDLISYLNDRV